ncbi:MAG: class F sortase [Candidatus Saccharimonadales bacterium]
MPKKYPKRRIRKSFNANWYHLPVITALTALLIGVALFAVSCGDTNHLGQTPTILSPTKPTVSPTPISLPLSITASSIGLQAPIVEVGTVNGAIGIPPNTTSVAYWQGSPSPGQSGVSLLDGHLDWYGVPCAVFCHLDNLTVGDTINIVLANTQQETWTVTKTLTLSSGDAPNWMLSKKGAPTLVLITCAGDWNASTQNYTQRLVVEAKLKL